METWARTRLEDLAREDLSGYVLKKDSPSCGMERVKVSGPKGEPAGDSSGLFAQALMRRLPDLPVEDEGRLSDPDVRAAFIQRVFDYWRRNHV